MEIGMRVNVWLLNCYRCGCGKPAGVTDCRVASERSCLSHWYNAVLFYETHLTSSGADNGGGRGPRPPPKWG